MEWNIYGFGHINVLQQHYNYKYENFHLIVVLLYNLEYKKKNQNCKLFLLKTKTTKYNETTKKNDKFFVVEYVLLVVKIIIKLPTKWLILFKWANETRMKNQLIFQQKQ